MMREGREGSLCKGGGKAEVDNGPPLNSNIKFNDDVKNYLLVNV